MSVVFLPGKCNNFHISLVSKARALNLNILNFTALDTTDWFTLLDSFQSEFGHVVCAVDGKDEFTTNKTHLCLQ